MADLLKNSGFEGITTPGGWTRVTYYGTEYGEIYVPDGWVAWWEEGKYRRPEMKVIPNQAPFLVPSRIRSGNWALQSFTFYGRQHAGYYQVVTGLTPGATYEFSAHAHAWSTTDGMVGTDDAHCSAGIGCEPRYLTDAEVPPLNGNPENDAIGNFTFQVGVQFTNPDPFYQVAWGERAHIYNGYFKVPPIRFIAPANGQVVVYLRAESLWEFRTSDAYWDDAELVEVESPAPEPQRGDPRIQYARTYILMPPDASIEWVLEAINNGGWNETRFTIGGSADDAALGDLDYRRIIALNPDMWADDLQAFFEEYYPGIIYVPVTATLGTLGRKLREALDLPIILLWQKDLPWRDVHYGGGLCDTIGNKGCWITDGAMGQRYLGIDPNATPLTVDAAVGAGGYASCRMLWSAMKAHLGLEVLKSTKSVVEAKAHLDSGGICFVEVLPTSMEHFVMVTRYEGNRYWMYDPLKPVEGWLDEHYQGAESWRLIRSAVTPPVTNLPHIYGVHEDCEKEAALLMCESGVQGHIVFTEGIGDDPNAFSGRDYNADTLGHILKDAHIAIARLNYGYGSSGTVPPPEQYGNFVTRVKNFVAQSQGCNIWIIGNEQNNPREWPGNDDGRGGIAITPEGYAALFNSCYVAIHEVQPSAIVMPGAVDGYNAQIGYSAPEYMRRLWAAIKKADAICMHAYTHGPNKALITAETKFGDAPMQGVYYDFLNFESLRAKLPQWAWKLPIYITETNHLYLEDSPNPQPPTFGWLDVQTGWIQEMYRFVDSWNRVHAQQIRCACLYRWPPIDAWVIHRKQNIIADFTGALKKGYRPYA